MCVDIGDGGPNQLHLRFESKGKIIVIVEGDRITDFNLGLIKIDGEIFNLPQL